MTRYVTCIGKSNRSSTRMVVFSGHGQSQSIWITIMMYLDRQMKTGIRNMSMHPGVQGLRVRLTSRRKVCETKSPTAHGSVWRRRTLWFLSKIKTWVSSRSEEDETLDVTVSFQLLEEIESDQNSTFKRINTSAIAWEMPIPSRGEVPLPSSSMSTSDCEPARPRIMADDSISFANVLRLFSIASS